MSDRDSASTELLIGHDRVRATIRRQLYNAIHVERRFTLAQLEIESGVKQRAIRSYMTEGFEGREPPLSAALSLLVVLGSRALNAMLSDIGYVAQPLDEADDMAPMQLVATAMTNLATIGHAAADNRIDHNEAPSVEQAADIIIETLTPLSSRGRAA